MGTALLARGLSGLPEDWLAARPGEIAAVHAAHVRAGAALCLTATFNLDAPRLATAATVRELASAAVRLARAAGAARVAGAVGPTCGERPGRYARAFEALAAAGVDLLWAESQLDLAEAREALAAGRALGLPCVVTVTFTRGDRLARGVPVGDALAALADGGAAAVGVSCVEAGPRLERILARAAPGLGVPLVAKPSPGLPGAVLAPAPFAERCAALAEAGAAWIGACCGATPEHVAAIARRLGAAR
jgi:5-methyltetrahydrofolate--homocysteine methyltransferase